MFFNSEKFHYTSFSSSLSSNSYNVYANPNMKIINPSDNVLDLGIFMSNNCLFEFHIQNLCSLDLIIVPSYGPPHLVKHMDK